MATSLKSLALCFLVFLSFGLAISSPPASASPGWELILDRPTPNFRGMDFTSESEGWLVAGAGLLHTTAAATGRPTAPASRSSRGATATARSTP